MANRPVFVSDDVFYVKTINTEFVFFNGLYFLRYGFKQLYG